MTSALSSVRIVLVGTTHPGNIGAAARAMKTMGLRHLYLVDPKHFPHAEADAMSSGADDLLRTAVLCEDLAQALRGCTLAIGTTARTRAYPFPILEPRAAAQVLMAEAASSQAALVFGPEHSGLSNRDLDLCQQATSIATNPYFSSLNVAAAVQVYSYELRLAALEADMAERPAAHAIPARVEDLPASAEDMEGFYGHMEETLTATGFLDPSNPKHLMRRLRLMYNRARLTRTEVNILRGILRACREPE